MITQNELKRLFSYSLQTGEFTRKTKTSSKVNIDEVAGSKDKDGYIIIGIKNKTYKAHRLAFLYVIGWVPESVDHVNHKTGDNRWINLRPANKKINGRNVKLPKNNKSGFIGVRKRKNLKKWNADIMVNNRNIHLGYFDNIEDAITARKEANIKYGFHENHGKNYDTNS